MTVTCFPPFLDFVEIELVRLLKEEGPAHQRFNLLFFKLGKKKELTSQNVEA